MSKENINKHGLSRTIPAEIKNQIRRADGYGCVKCGNLFIEYEHIDPLYCDAKVHDPEKITLLCKGCHGDSTGKRLPKELIKRLKANPYCKKKGIVKGQFYPDPTKMEIFCGSSFFRDTQIIFQINGKPLIWVSRDDYNEFSPLFYNAIFYDSDGNKIGYLNKNHFIGLVKTADIKSIASRVEVRSRPKEITLDIDLEGYKSIRINRINMSYLNTHIVIEKNGDIVLDPRGANNRFGSISASHCRVGISINGIRRIPTKLDKLVFYARNGLINIIDIFGQIQGHFVGGEIYDKHKNLVGYCKNNKIYNLVDEFIGNIMQNNLGIMITMDKDEYDDQEPIWFSKENAILNKFLIKPIYDTSYRLFA